MNLTDVTAVLVTRGDVPMDDILRSLVFQRVIVWDNAATEENLGAYGRYEAALAAQTPLVYFQDDDCLVSEQAQLDLLASMTEDPVPWLSNMNPSHNANMPLLALPGWGALTWPGHVQAAIHRWGNVYPADLRSDDFLTIGCDIVIPVLTESRMIDLGHESFSYAHGEDRTHKREDYVGKKMWYYREAAKIRGLIEAAA